MSKKKRFIQVGLGGFGSYWVNTVMPRLVDELQLVEAAAVADIRADTFPDAMKKYHLPGDKCYTDVKKAFMENAADFAVIVVPPAHHESIVGLALENDMDILLEKPIADTMEACCRIYKKVTAAGKRMAVTMSHRFDQDKQTLERLIKSGLYGKLDYLIGRNTWAMRKFGNWGKFRYKIPDPLLIEGTVHHFDIMRALSGSNAKIVYAKTWNPRWSEFSGDAQGLITVEMENGVKVLYEGAKCNASSLNGWCRDYWRAECDKATLELDNRKLRVMTGALTFDASLQEVLLDEQDVWMNPYLAELFVKWTNGGPEPPNTLEDNIQCAALLFAAIESAHSNKVIDVQDFLKKAMAAVEIQS